MNKILAWQCFYIGITAFLSQTGHVTSHGRLIKPAQRSSAWRSGYDNPINYNDNELSCGGAGVQWGVNDGRCGVCGDPFHFAVKPNEDVNGTYVKNGVITGSYDKGQVMSTQVDITAYHKGWFEFRLCPLPTTTTKVTQACLNQTLLQVAGSNTSRIFLSDIKNGSGVQIYEIDLQLPSNITCERCVLQWKYNTGNSWGCESTGCCIGCGKQENFVNCADIRITDVQNGTSTTQNTSSASQSATMTALMSSTASQTSTSSVSASSFSTSTTPSTVSTSSTYSAFSTNSTTTPQTTNITTTASSTNTSQASLLSSSATEATTASQVTSRTNTDSSSANNNSQTTSSPLSSASTINENTTTLSDNNSQTTSPLSSTTTVPNEDSTTSNSNSQISSSLPPSSASTTTNGDSSASSNNSQTTSSLPPSSDTTTTNGDSSTSSSNSQTSSSSSPPSSATTTTNGSLYETCSSTLSCRAVFPYSMVPGMASWCCNNCLQGYCPSSHCSCSAS